MIELDAYRALAEPAAWQPGDLALARRHGVVKVVDRRRVDDTWFLHVAPVLVFEPLNLTAIPLSAAAEHLVPVASRGEAARLLALLRDRATTRRPGDARARRVRCERTLGSGEVARVRCAMHELYSEPHAPTAEDLRALEPLERYVVGELACALGRDLEELVRELRRAHARFSPGAPGAGDVGDAAPRFELGARTRVWGGDGDHVELVTLAGRWLGVKAPAGGPWRGVAVHERHVEVAEALLEQARFAARTNTEGAMVFAEDAVCVDDPAVVGERFDPVDRTIHGRGIWWSTGGDGDFDVAVTYADEVAVLIAVRDPDDERDEP